MKIYKRAEFLSLPAGTVFCNYTPMYSGPLSVKTSGPGEFGDDFCRQTVSALQVDADSSTGWMDKLQDMEDNGTEHPLVFDSSGRDGMYEPGQLFAVLDDKDVQAMIAVLTVSWRQP